jgi:DNA-binding SARP family transcriptional activator
VRGDLVLRLLGPVEVRAGDGWISPGTPQARLLLALMAVRVGGVVPVSELVDAMWDQAPPRSARASVQVLVTRLRQLLAPAGGVIERSGDGYRLELEPDLMDLRRFRSLARAGRAAADCLAAVRSFDSALSLWHGPALADVPASPAIDTVRSGLAVEQLSVIEDRASAMLGCGLEREAIAELPALLAMHPLAEGLAGSLMLALYRCGQQADALKVFRDMRARLAGQLGVEPGPALQGLHQRVLARDPRLAAPTPTATRPG